MSGAEHDNLGERRLAAALAVAREQWPDGAALERVRQGVSSALVSQPPSSGRTQARLLRQSTRAWLRGGTLVLLIGAGFGAWRLGADSSRAEVAPPRPVAPREVTAALQAPVAAAVETAVAPSPAQAAAVRGAAPALRGGAASDEAPHKLRARAPRATARVVVPAPAVAAPADPEAELALLRRAMAALQRHPSESLELAAEHERDYPNGIFGQEREVIAIDALVALQQTSAAEARARAFIAHHPRSAHAPRIRALLGGQAKGAASHGLPQMALGQSGR